MLENNLNNKPVKTVLFIYLLIFLIIHIGSHISLLARQDLSVSDYYLPTALSLVLIHWLGPVYVLPVLYINAVCTSFLWGNPLERWPLWFLFAIPETLYAFLSWFLFRVIGHGKYWLPDIRNTSLFLAAGIFVPAIIEAFLLQSMLVWANHQSGDTYWVYIGSNLLSEFTTSLCLTLPALYYFTPFLQKKGYIYQSHPEKISSDKLSRKQIIQLTIVFVCLSVLVFFLEFTRYWYVYGLFALFVAIRYGFGPAILTNFYILLIVYILPKIFTTFGENDVGDYRDVINIFLGADLLFVFAIITGRVISDLKHAEVKLKQRNEELKQTNNELDRFVYSVSHDLTAPLKSILGLVNISRLTNDPENHTDYLNRIEKSVQKLEAFIAEVLDYSRNQRQEVLAEKIQLQELCQEILSNIQHMNSLQTIRVEFELYEPEIWQDKSRLKIILHNLLSNAIKFQKRHPGHQPLIKITSSKSNEDYLIQVEDNGEGIRPEQQERIFAMFYRGNEQSTGSGLGLYIAKEVTLKLNGKLQVSSEYGKGSVFEVYLKSLK